MSYFVGLIKEKIMHGRKNREKIKSTTLSLMRKDMLFLIAIYPKIRRKKVLIAAFSSFNVAI